MTFERDPPGPSEGAADVVGAELGCKLNGRIRCWKRRTVPQINRSISTLSLLPGLNVGTMPSASDEANAGFARRREECRTLISSSKGGRAEETARTANQVAESAPVNDPPPLEEDHLRRAGQHLGEREVEVAPRGALDPCPKSRRSRESGSFLMPQRLSTPRMGVVTPGWPSDSAVRRWGESYLI